MIRARASWPWIGLALGLVLMAPGLTARVAAESQYTTYELTMPDTTIANLIASGVPEDELYGQLAEAGLQSAAVKMMTLGDLEAAGRIVILEPRELAAQLNLLGLPGGGLSSGGVYIAFSEDEAWILETLAQVAPTSQVRPVTVGNRSFYLVTGIVDVSNTPVGYDLGRVSELMARGIGVIARLPGDGRDVDFVKSQLEALRAEFGIDRVMFSGQTTPFSRSAERDTAFATWLADHGYTLIDTEFVDQAGSTRYLSVINRVTRLHSLDMEAVPETSTAISRSIRAIRERSVRIIFVRPSPIEPVADQLAWVTDVMNGVTSGTSGQYVLGVAQPMPLLSPSPILWAGAVLASASIAAAALAFASLAAALVGGVAMGLIGVASVLSGSMIVGDVLRLAVAILFAIAAVLVARPVLHLPAASLSFVKTVGVVLAGGLTITGLTYGTEFRLSAGEFWGIKALLVVPPAVIAVIAGYIALGHPRWSELPSAVTHVAHARLRVWHLGAVGFAAVMVWYLLVRSDNSGIASELELQFRQALENLFPVRPRTKEFLFGFPALLVGIVLAARHPWAWWLFVAAAIGTASAIDTFTHYHYPLLDSLVRTVLAFALGYLIGLAGLAVLELWHRRTRTRSPARSA